MYVLWMYVCVYVWLYGVHMHACMGVRMHSGVARPNKLAGHNLGMLMYYLYRLSFLSGRAQHLAGCVATMQYVVADKSLAKA